MLPDNGLHRQFFFNLVIERHRAALHSANSKWIGPSFYPMDRMPAAQRPLNENHVRSPRMIRPAVYANVDVNE